MGRRPRIYFFYPDKRYFIKKAQITFPAPWKPFDKLCYALAKDLTLKSVHTSKAVLYPLANIALWVPWLLLGQKLRENTNPIPQKRSLFLGVGGCRDSIYEQNYKG